MNEVAVIDDNINDVATPISDETLISLAESAEKRIDAMTKIKKVSLKLTNKHDWTDQGGKPYLQVSGAEKIARMFGIGWRISEPKEEMQEGGHFSFTYKGVFTLAGKEIDCIGTRSSKDGFFKKYDWSKKDANGDAIKTELPPSEIDRGDVKKAAYTNCIGNGITRILGLRNMTYEDLEEFAGLTKNDIGKVDYKKNGKQKDAIKSEGSQTVTVDITDVKQQTKKKDGTPMKSPLFIIKAGDSEYKTFSESMAKQIKEAMDAGLKVEITFVTDKFGNNIESVLKCEPAAERQPGEEG